MINIKNPSRYLLFVFSITAMMVLVSYSGLSHSQDNPVSTLQNLMQNPKIVSKDEVLSAFTVGEPTTPVIVILRDPATDLPNVKGPPKNHSTPQDQAAGPGRTRSLKTMALREQLRSEVRTVQNGIIPGLDSAQVRITNRFSYIFGFSADVTQQGLQDLLDRDDVVAIEPDRILYANLAQGIPLMNATTPRSSYYGSGLSIAICDTGIDTSHSALGGIGMPVFNTKVIGGYDTGDDDGDPRPDPTLGNAHGTACAGIAAGSLGSTGDYIGGVAYGARLYAVKISTGNTGSASTANMIEGWEWCITHQLDDPDNPIMIISTSFGGGQLFSICDSESAAMTQAAANAVEAGITVFVSSGNDGYCDAMGWPACISHVISVGAVYDAAFGIYQPCVSGDSCATKKADASCPSGYYATDVTAADMVTSYSNTASFLNLLAPSNAAYTTDIVGAGGYDSGDYDPSFGGTSAACPYAAGAGAILQSAAMARYGHYLPPDRVKSILTGTGDPITDGKVAITKPRVNVQNAVAGVQGSNVVLWNQPASGSNPGVYSSQDFSTPYNTNDVFIADDFTNDHPWRINRIFIPGGWYPGCDLTCADALNFQIYNDNAGLPDGYPDGGGGGSGTPVWSLSLPPSSGQITLSTGIDGSALTNVTLSLNGPIKLGPGTYWFVFYPTMGHVLCCQYGRLVSETTNGYVAQVINPGGAFGFGTSWTSVQSPSPWGLSEQDTAFRLDGYMGSGSILTGPYLLLLAQ